MTALLEAPALGVPDKVKADIQLTVDEFLALDEVDGDEYFFEDYELVRGIVVSKRKPNPSGKHGEIIAQLTIALGIFMSQKQKDEQGRIFVEAPCIINETAYFIPDLCFVAAGRIEQKNFEGVIPVVPDFVLEVNSPSDTQKQIYDKIEDYQKAGVRLIWSVYMLHEFVVVHRLGETEVETLNPNGELDGYDVLPGFKMKVSNLFSKTVKSS